MKLTRLTTALAGAALALGAIAFADAATDQTIVTVVKVTGINWFNRMDEGVKEFAKDNPGINAYQTGPGRADAAQQLKIIEDLIAKKVTALAVVPFDPPTLEPRAQEGDGSRHQGRHARSRQREEHRCRYRGVRQLGLRRRAQ